MSPAHGKGGVRATSLSFLLSVPPPSEKTLSGFQQAGKKEGDMLCQVFLWITAHRSVISEVILSGVLV